MFSTKSFSPVSFSLDSFRLSQASHSQDGRSGYWRLFYYQLQEKALVKKVKPVVVRPTKKPQKTVKVKHAEPVTQELCELEEQECPVPRIKLLRPVKPRVKFGIQLPDMMWIYSVLNELCFTFPNKRSIVELSEPPAAVEETQVFDNEVLLLLLAV